MDTETVNRSHGRVNQNNINVIQFLIRKPASTDGWGWMVGWLNNTQTYTHTQMTTYFGGVSCK